MLLLPPSRLPWFDLYPEAFLIACNLLGSQLLPGQPWVPCRDRSKEGLSLGSKGPGWSIMVPAPTRTHAFPGGLLKYLDLQAAGMPHPLHGHCSLGR